MIPHHPKFLICAALLAGLASLSEAQTTRTWDRGGGNNNWNTGANWNPDGVPANGDIIIIDHTFVGGAITVTVNAATNAMASITMDPRAGAFAAGNITFQVSQAVTTTDLFIDPDTGLTVDIQNTSNGRAFRVDGRIEIGIGYTPTGGTVNFATFDAGNDMDYKFHLGATDATLDIGENVEVTIHLHNFTDGPANTADCFLSWIRIANGATMIFDCEDQGGVNARRCRVTSEDAGNPGRALVIGAGATLSLRLNGDEKVTLRLEADGSTCTFGDGDATAEVATINGSGLLEVRGSMTWQRAAGGVDNVTGAVQNVQYQQTTAAETWTFADGLTVDFDGPVFDYVMGSIACGTTAANTGTIAIDGDTIGGGSLIIPNDAATSDVTHTITVNGGGALILRRPVLLDGNGTGVGGGQGRIVANDTASVTLGTAVGDVVELRGALDVSQPNPGQIVLNGSSTLTIPGVLTLSSEDNAGGNLSINGSSTATVTSNVNCNVTASVNDDGGTITIAGTGRLSVGGTLILQGNNTAAVGGKVTVSSTRASPGALSVTGLTTIQAGTACGGDLTITTDSLVTFTGGLTINASTVNGKFDVTDASAPGPTVTIDGDVTVNGQWIPTAGARSTIALGGSAAQSFGGTRTLVSFDNLRFECAANRTVSFSNADTIYTVSGTLGSGGSAGTVTVDATAARTFLAQATFDFDRPTVFSTNTTVEMAQAADQAIDGSSGTAPVFNHLTTSGSGTKSSTFTTTTVNGTLTVGAGTTLLVSSGHTWSLARDKGAFPPDQHTVSGELRVTTGTPGNGLTTFKLGSRQQLVFASGSTFRVVAFDSFSFASTRYALFTRDSAGDGYGIHCRNGSTVDVQYVRFEYLYGRSSANETTEGGIESAFTISTDSVTRFLSIWFDLCVDGGTGGANTRFPRYLYLHADLDGDGADDAGEPSLHAMGSYQVLNKLRFDDASGLANQSNVEKRAPGDTVYPRHCSGTLGTPGATAEANDMDGDRPGAPTGDTGIDDVIFTGGNATAVDLVGLSAAGYDAEVLLEWSTNQEVDNLGFNVYRSLAPDRGWVRANDALILGLGDSAAGGRYWFRDRGLADGTRYYYLLEDVDVRGERTLHGPVDAQPSRAAGRPSIDASLYVNGASSDPSAPSASGSGASPAAGLGPVQAAPGVEADQAQALLVGVDLGEGIRLLSYGPGGAVIEIRTPAPSFTPEVWDGRLGTRIEMAGHATSRTPGRPALPTRSLLLVTPWIESASARILADDAEPHAGIVPVLAPASVAPARILSAQDGGVVTRAPRSINDLLRLKRNELAAERIQSRNDLLEARREAIRRLTGGSPDRRSGEGSGGVDQGSPAHAAGASPAAAFWPESPIALGALGAQGGRQILPIEIVPVQVDEAASRALVHRRIVVAVDFAAAGAGRPTPIAPPAGGPFDTAEQLRLAGDPRALVVHVDRDGLYRLGRAELAAAGFDVGADPRTFRMFHLGVEVAIRVEGELDGSFDGADAVLFYGRRNPWRLEHHPEATRYTDRSAYWLVAGPGRGRRMEELWVPPRTGEAPAADFETVLHLEENGAFHPMLSGGEGRDHWFDANRRLLNTSGGAHPLARRTVVLSTPHLSASAHTVRLEVALAGLSSLPADPDHHLVLTLSGRALGDVRWDGPTAQVVSFEIPSTALSRGENVLELHLPGDLPGVSIDSVILDYTRLTYRRTFVAEGDSLSFALDGSRGVAATGFSSDAVLGVDRTDPFAPRWMKGLSATPDGVALREPSAGRTEILLAGPGGVLAPRSIEPNVPSTWHAAGQGADWVAIVHPTLREAVLPLADLRASQGLATAVVDVTDVYDEFTAGIPDPDAIRAFLAHASTAWSPAPRYVVLVGDGHWDPHGWTTAEPDLVPVRMTQLEGYWSASDNGYAAFAGDDPLPDLALGRIPARTPEELASTVAKIVAWETAPSPAWRRNVSLVADNDDAAYDFTRVLDESAAILRPAFEVEELALARLGRAATTSRIRDAFAAGRFLIAYTGHGDLAGWAAEQLLTAPQVRALGNERQGVVVAMDCMNGMFHVPGREAMGEALVRADRAGAIAFWGSTTLSDPVSQEATFAQLARILAEGGPATLGDAIDAAKVRCWSAGTDRGDVLRGWVLLGDPATRLAR